MLTTLLLVTVASQIVGYGLNQRWLLLAPIEGRDSRAIISAQLESDTRIPRVTMFGNEFPSSFIFGVVVAIALYIVMNRTVWGFRLRMLGQNARTARRAGVSDTRYGSTALMLSGGFAGFGRRA